MLTRVRTLHTWEVGRRSVSSLEMYARLYVYNHITTVCSFGLDLSREVPNSAPKWWESGDRFVRVHRIGEIVIAFRKSFFRYACRVMMTLTNPGRRP